MSKRMAAVGVGAVAVVGGAFAVVLPMLDGRPGGPSAAVVFDGLTAASFGVAGAVLTWARPRNAIGWVLLVIALCEGLADGGTSWALAADADDEWRTGAAWLASWVWFPALGLMPTVVIALYPTGLARSRMRRLLVATAAVAVAAVTAGFALVEDAVDDIVPGLDNPVAVQPLGTGLAVFGGLLLVPCVLLTLVDAGRRLWRSTSPEREQLAWLLTTVVLAVVISASPWHTVRAAVYVLVPVAIAVGVVRHRLLDLQIVVRRTLLFAGLMAVVVGVFVVSTTLVSNVIGDGPLPVAVAAALVAVGLTPVRDRLQRAVDRLIYGDRHDPVRAVASLGRHVAEHDEGRLVDQVLATIAAAVRSPHVVLLDPDGHLRADAGAAATGDPLRLPLNVGGRDVGCLLVTPRTPRDGWSAADRALLDVLAPQVAVVVHAARLNADLTASRDLVVAATVDERQRLRQELHDGLGPALSGIALGLEAVEASLPRDPHRAKVLLERLRRETQGAGGEVRRLVEGLRPAALDGQALDEALRAFTDGLAATIGDRLNIDLHVEEQLSLSPDVDAATYRIVTEAVTNVVRHSGARCCSVHVTTDAAALRIVVEDDGTGLPAQPREGVGLVSMRRRAAELGGSWTAEPRRSGGTVVCVELPLTHVSPPPMVEPAGAPT